ncbi:MAG: DUF3783 domain-containing protein [Candidatus Thermoplasmatota archaeon]|nr:DUF3783 domain-containing protein [Candidatus Thermoplasmatota archaeon]
MDDEMRGMLLHGFGKEWLGSLGDHASAVTAVNVEVLSASGLEERAMSEILDSGGSGVFHETGAKVLVFLGFTDNELSRFIDGYPSDVPRPIFCCLTAENVNWSFDRLIVDLLEEDRYWKERSKKERVDQGECS